MNVLANFWYEMINSILTATSVLVIAGGLAGIICIILFSIRWLKKISPALAIIISTIVSCVLMVPVISSFNNLVRMKVEGTIIDDERAQLQRLRAENRVKLLEQEKLENQITIARQSIEIQALNDSTKLLENAQISMQSFEKILELALLQTNLQQTLVRKEPISSLEAGWGLRADYYYDEILVVHTHDINAKFGIDLNEVKIAKLDENTVSVSGIKPKFIGTSRNLTTTPIKEVRTNNYKNGVLVRVDTKYDTQGISKANELAQFYEREFQTKLSQGLELDFMNDAVILLAQNFIRVMFAPLYGNILFNAGETPDAVSITEYLSRNIKDNTDKKIELQDENEKLLSTVLKLDVEIEGIEQ